MNRREILKTLAVGTVGFGFSGYESVAQKSTKAFEPVYTGHGRKATFEKVLTPSHVSLVKGNNERDNAFKALKNIESEIMRDLEGRHRILIKPNFVVVNNPLCATGVDTVRGVLDFIKPRFKGQIEIGESSVSSAFGNGQDTTYNGFKNYGYLPLEKEYGVKLTDLNLEPTVNHYVFSPHGNKPIGIRIIRNFADRDQYLISVGKMKTHNFALVTLSLKNILMGSPINDYKSSNDKAKMHAWNFKTFQRGMKLETGKDLILHYNLFQLTQITYPDLAVIDGFVSMEGDGPIDGTPIDTRISLASVDPLALDSLGAKVMGFDPTQILYLSSMNEAGLGQGDLDKITVLGSNLNDCLFHFKPHKDLAESYGLTI